MGTRTDRQRVAAGPASAGPLARVAHPRGARSGKPQAPAVRDAILDVAEPPRSG